ncbi:flocculation protein FLO11-like [Diaphorina citri]|uniref:Flocculation protein FLO11-like n=1 Tax=Diaphorina citri TaxID=121845 RepID=A0A1S3DRV1_DIACI|nr:flocculation protein FLO11-like [Diaphorina citri]
MGRSEDSRAYLDSSCPSTLGRYSDYPKEGSLGRYSDSLGRYRDAEPGSRDNIDKPGRDGQNFKNNREKRSQDLNASESELQPLNNRAGLDGESRQFSSLARPSLKSLGEGSSTHSLPVAMETERRVSQTNNAPSVAMTTNDLGPERNPTSGTNPKGNSATVERNPAHPGGNYAAMNYTGRNPTSTGRSSNAIAGNPANSPPLSNAIGNPAQPASLTNDIGNSATIGNATANPSSGNVANTIGNFRSIGNAIQGNSTLGNATTVPRGGPTSNFVNNLPSPGSNIGNSLTTPTSIGNSLATPTGSIGNSLATPTSTLLGANGHLSGGVTGGAHRRNGAAPPTNSMPC